MQEATFDGLENCSDRLVLLCGLTSLTSVWRRASQGFVERRRASRSVQRPGQLRHKIDAASPQYPQAAAAREADGGGGGGELHLPYSIPEP